jgi:YVTN family beta-propeller protein
MRTLALLFTMAVSLLLTGCGGGGGGTATSPSGTATSTSTTATSPTGTTITTIYSGGGGSGSSTSGSGTSGTVSSGQAYPQGIAVYGSTLYVANTAGNSISAISLSDPTHPVTPITLYFPTGVPQLTSPTGLAISPDGTTLYVASWFGAYIDSISLIDGVVKPLAVNSDLPTNFKLDNPDGIALSPDGNSLFVANPGNGNVLQISTNPSTSQNVFIAAYEYPPSEASNPGSVYADASCNCVYASSSNGVFGEWPIVSSAQSPTTSFSPILSKSFLYPSGITGSGGYIYVADYQAETISKIDTATGSIVSTVSVSPNQPFYLAQDGTNLYFTDGNNGAVNAIPLP